MRDLNLLIVWYVLFSRLPDMPGSVLWAVDVYGRVFSLGTTGGRWNKSKDVLLELKRVTAAEQGCWGIGCDHQVYLHVLRSDVPIRHQEETYENQVQYTACTCTVCPEVSRHPSFRSTRRLHRCSIAHRLYNLRRKASPMQSDTQPHTVA